MKLERQLAEYGQHLRQAIAVLEVPLRPEGAVRPLPAEGPDNRSRWLVAAAAAVVVAAAIALAAILRSAVAPDPAPFVDDGGTASTVPTGPPTQWETVRFSAEQGLPHSGIAGVAVDEDGIPWAAQVQADRLQLFRLEGDRWAPAGEPLAAPFYYWMTPDGSGGLLLAVPPPGWTEEPTITQRIVRFDGASWQGFDEGGLLPDLEVSAVEEGADGVTWIVGYRAIDHRLEVARVTGGDLTTYVAEDADRGPAGSPSYTVISETVDVAPDGAVWAGSPDGVWRFQDDRFTRYAPPPNPTGECCGPLAVDATGTVWMALGSEVYRLTGGDWVQALTIDLGPENPGWWIGPIITTPDGGVWVLAPSPAASVHRYDGSEWSVHSWADAEAMGLPTRTSPTTEFAAMRSADGTNATIQYGRDGSAGRVHLFLDGRWQPLPTDDLDLTWGEHSADRITGGMAVGPDGSVWLPLGNGVARLSPAPASG